MNRYYSSQFIWKRIGEDQAVRYLCLLDLASNKYAVQNAEFFYLPLTKDRLLEADANSMELFIEIEPLERCDWFDELVEAIEDHDLKFS
jgi:hypothetical protein